MNISLLPAPIRARLNRRLDAGEADAPILDWLRSTPEVQALSIVPSVPFVPSFPSGCFRLIPANSDL